MSGTRYPGQMRFLQWRARAGIAVVVIALSTPGCGALLGSQGAAETAKTNLTPPEEVAGAVAAPPAPSAPRRSSADPGSLEEASMSSAGQESDDSVHDEATFTDPGGSTTVLLPDSLDAAASPLSDLNPRVRTATEGLDPTTKRFCDVAADFTNRVSETIDSLGDARVTRAQADFISSSFDQVSSATPPALLATVSVLRESVTKVTGAMPGMSGREGRAAVLLLLTEHKPEFDVIALLCFDAPPPSS